MAMATTIHVQTTPVALTVSRKRPGEGLNDSGTTAKRRSSRACLSCRSRKVRCDVVRGGVPCTNCRLDDVECVIQESSRGRKPGSTSRSNDAGCAARPATVSSVTRAQQLADARHEPPSEQQSADYLMSLTFEDQRDSSQSGDDSQDDESHSDNIMDDAICDDTQEVFPPPPPPQQQQPDQYGETLEDAANSSVSPQRSHPSHRSHTSNRSHHHIAPQSIPVPIPCPTAHMDHLDPVETPLPSYIKRLPRRLGQKDINYLVDKDALTIPDDELRDELLRTYVKIIHCFMPALDLDDLLAPIISSSSSASSSSSSSSSGDTPTRRPVSLLLFQSVMFASVIFVDWDLLRSRGFSSRRAARRIFFSRVRLLYGLDCEPDKLALIQSLLLMTYWYDSPDDEKDTWHWMGIALSMSQVMGLHRDPETLNIPLREKRLRRRIWWSCFIRDRLLALGIRRPTRIRHEDFNVGMLELDDFDLVQPNKAHRAFVHECAFTTPEEDARRAMCQICIELAKLCVCIGNILHSQYSVVVNSNSSSSGGNGAHRPAAASSEHYRNIAVLPRNSEDKQLAELARCDAELEDWCRNQKSTCRYAPPSPPVSTSGSGFGLGGLSFTPFGENGGNDDSSDDDNDWAGKVTWLHQALLRMVYLTALGALHRPRALGVFYSTSSSSLRSPEAPEAAAARKTSVRRVKEAATAMSKLGCDLQAENQLRYLSTSSVPAFLSATIIHLLDTRDPDEEVRSLGIGRFLQCYHTLYELQDMYASADYAIRFLGTVVKRINANIPMLPVLNPLLAQRAAHQQQVALNDVHHSSYTSFSYDAHRRRSSAAAAAPRRYATPPESAGHSVPMPASAPVLAPSVPPAPMMHADLGFSRHSTEYPTDYLALMQQLSPEMAGLGATSPPTDAFEPGTFSSGLGTDHSMAAEVQQMDMWNSMDALLPALLNFDAEHNIMVPG